MTAVKIDDKGRITVPASDREALGIRPGDIVFIERRGNQLIAIRADNPFDLLAEDAIEEYHHGDTRNLRAIAHERGIALDAP